MFELLRYFPPNIANILKEYTKDIENNLQEIRIRVNNPIILKYGDKKEVILEHKVSQREIMQIMQMICDNSIYSYQSEIINGFVTIKRRTQSRNYW